MKLRGIFQFTEVHSFDEREIKRISFKYNKTSLNFSENFSIQFVRVSSGICNILERGVPICGLRPNHVCEVSR
jgi:hypothetical protein